MNNLLLIDGTALVFRGFYAIPPLKSEDGTPTNAILGFFNILIQLLIQESPEYFAICFDRGETTHRKQEYTEYKANRSKAPDELYIQINIVQELLKQSGLNYLDSKGYEADDIIATLCKSPNLYKKIYSSDFDLMQLISEDTIVLKPAKGPKKYEEYDLNKFNEKYNFQPTQVTDFKGLSGDSSDNLPGVPGVGPKTALKLLDEYKTLENIIENVENIKGALGNKIKENIESATMSKKLATLDSNVPDLDYKKLNCANINYPKLILGLEELGLRTLPSKVLRLKKILDQNIVVENQQSLF